MTMVFFFVVACGSLGPPTDLTAEQFANLKEACNLPDARLVPTNRTETTTVDGIPMTMTNTNEDPNSVTIQLSRIRDDGEMAQVVMCVTDEFERLNAIAHLEPAAGSLSF
ncbi:MAG: hypothetical protein AAGE05_00800 [Pseudomonadota bacterium]